MVRKRISIICLVALIVFGFLSMGINVGAKIDTDSRLMVVNTGTEGTHPIVDGEIIVFSSYTVSDPMLEVFYHNITTRTTVNTGIQGYHWGVDIPYIMIWSPEWFFGDLNGDGDANDAVESVYDIRTGKCTVFAENALICWPCLANGKAVYSLSEIYNQIDYNNDGDKEDRCGFYYDAASNTSSYFADAFYTKIYGNDIVYEIYGTLWYFDLTSNTSVEIGVEKSYPGIDVTEWKVDGNIIGLELHECGPTGTDLNCNGEYYDFFSAYYSISTGTLNIITDFESRFVDVSNGKILMERFYSWPYPPYPYYTYDINTGTITELQGFNGYLPNMEGNIVVANDWSGIMIPEAPPPVGVPNVLIYDMTTQELVNTSIVGFLDYWQGNFDGYTIAIVTNEANMAEDLNGDGDISDHIVRYIIKQKLIQASIDIDPDTLNIKSKGNWMTCYIEIPEENLITDIDVSTILLEDAIEIETRPLILGDHDNDGIPDLTAKFDRSDVEDMLLPGTYELKVTGELSGEIIFEGISDPIKVINPP